MILSGIKQTDIDMVSSGDKANDTVLLTLLRK